MLPDYLAIHTYNLYICVTIVANHWRCRVSCLENLIKEPQNFIFGPLNNLNHIVVCLVFYGKLCSQMADHTT